MLNAIYSKTKETLRTADKITLTIVIFIIIGAFIIIPAAAAGPGNTGTSGSGGKVVTSLAGLDMNIGAFSGLITDAFSEAMGSVSGNAKERAEFVKSFDYIPDLPLDTSSSDVGLHNIGNVLGVQSSKTSKSHTSNIYSIGDDQTSMRLTLDTISRWHNDGGDGSGDEDGMDINSMSEKLAHSAMSQYIVFGSALNAMGIDEFRSATGNADMLRMITGYIMYICFILAYSAAGLMKTVVELLRYLNIFGILHNYMMSPSVTGATNVTNGLVDINAGYRVGTSTALIDSLKSIYRMLMPFKWLILGILVVLFVGSITIYKSKAAGAAGNTQTRARKLILRVIIMCIGLPLVGMVYTTCLDATYDGLEDAGYNVTDYAYSQFLDYEQWLIKDPSKAFEGLNEWVAGDDQNTGYYITMAVTLDTGRKTIDVYRDDQTTRKPINVSEVIYNINRKMYGYDLLEVDYENSAHASALYQTTNGQYNTNKYNELVTKNPPTQNPSDTEKADAAEAYKIARELMLKYARNNTVVADKLNKFYVEGLGQLGADLKIASNDDDEKTAYNAILTRLLSPDSSSNVWAYCAQLENGQSKEFDKWGDKFTVTVKGMPVFTRRYGNNRIMVQKDGVVWPNGEPAGVLWQVLGPVMQYNDQATPTGVDFKATHAEITYIPDTDLDKGPGHYIYEYEYGGEGMSPLALYNFLHSKFELGVLDVYTPALTSNSGVSTMHYAVTTPYSGIPEVVQILFTICMLFSIGIIGWVFGVSLLLNTIVQTLKAIPLIFKMAIGSISGFVQSILVVLSIIAEMLITVALYAFSIQIIDFLIAVVDTIATAVMDAFVNTDGETLALINNLLTMGIILWGTFELIRWRQVVTMSVKSAITHVVNSVFGTNVSMPSSASSGMLKAAAVGMTAAAVGGALAEQGTLDDVVNDMTQSDIGSSVSDKLKEGDFGGALQDVKDFAKGEYDGDVRGGSAMDREAQAKGLLPKYDENGNRMHDEETGEGLYEDPMTGETYSESEMQDLPDNSQNLTEDQQKAVDDMDAKISGMRAEAKAKAKDPDKKDEAEALEKQADDLAMQRAAMVGGFRRDNYAKAKEAGVSDWADYEKSLADTNTGASEYAPETVEAADIPEKPSGHELTGEAKNAYAAAQKGDAEALRKAGSTFNAHGVDAKQQGSINEMIANGASEEEVSAAIDNFAQQNFGDDYAAVVDKMNEACGRSGSFTYGSTDNGEGNARTVSVDAASSEGGNRQYTAQDYAGTRGAQVIAVSDNNGVSSYINVTQGGGESNTVQTVDMGTSGNAGAQDYAGTFNSVASMVRASGVNVTSQAMGAGTSQQVTITEMAAQSSTLQAAQMGYTVNQQGFGNNQAVDVGMAMTTTQVQATTRTAASGGDVKSVQVEYTPLTVSNAAGSAAGVATYNAATATVGGETQVQLIRTGGVETTPGTMNVQYNSPGQSNFVGLSGVSNDSANVNVPMEDGMLKMVKAATAVKVVEKVVDSLNSSDKDDGTQ